MSHMRKFLGRIENPLRQATGDTAHADLPKDIRLLLRTLERIERRLNSTHTALLHRTLRDALSNEEMMDVFRVLVITLHPPRKKSRLTSS